MNRMLRIFFLFAILYLSAVTVQADVNPKKTDNLSSALTEYGLSIQGGDFFSVIRKHKYPANDKTYRKIIAEHNGTRIEMELIRPVQDPEFTQNAVSKYTIVDSLFYPQIVPYSGAVTNTTDCPESKKPKEIQAEILGTVQKILLVNAGMRYVIGACEEGSIHYKAVFVVLLDKSKSLQCEIIIYQPVETFNLDEVLGILKSLKDI